MTTPRTDADDAADALETDERIRARAQAIADKLHKTYPGGAGLGVNQCAAVIGEYTPMRGSGQMVGRWLRNGKRITKANGKPITRAERSTSWIIPVEDLAHSIAVMIEGRAFGVWWGEAINARTCALRYGPSAQADALDPGPGLDALRGALVDVLRAAIADIERATLEDTVAGDV